MESFLTASSSCCSLLSQHGDPPMQVRQAAAELAERSGQQPLPSSPAVAPQPRAAPHGACAGLRSSTEIPEGDPASVSGAAEENQGLKGKEQCAQENEGRARRLAPAEEEPTARPDVSARPCGSCCVQRPGDLNLTCAFHCVSCLSSLILCVYEKSQKIQMDNINQRTSF